MNQKGINRRDWLKGAGASLLTAATLKAQTTPQPPAQQIPEGQTSTHLLDPQESVGEPPAIAANREQRMQWWHAARFGMFVHWGLYSARARHEWAMENEAIPIEDYDKRYLVGVKFVSGLSSNPKERVFEQRA